MPANEFLYRERVGTGMYVCGYIHVHGADARMCAHGDLRYATARELMCIWLNRSMCAQGFADADHFISFQRIRAKLLEC